jgi:hypothetical protein
MSSKGRFLEEKTPPIDWRVPTNAEDVRVLRLLRETPRPWPLTRLNELAPSSLFPAAGRRGVPPRHEPFRL